MYPGHRAVFRNPLAEYTALGLATTRQWPILYAPLIALHFAGDRKMELGKMKGRISDYGLWIAEYEGVKNWGK